MTDSKIIVVIGATGHFGGRICRRIVTERNIRLVVTSRDASKAKRLAAELQNQYPGAQLTAAWVDQSREGLDRQLKALSPDIVLHTAGPYQGQDYRVAEACLDCGSHYIDLADGRQFVAGFSSLNNQAQEKGLLLVSGASTLPGLSSAVVAALINRFESIDSITISIAPAHQTPRGGGTIGAVLSYCGKPFEVLVDGVWVTRYGWQDLRIQRYPALGRRLSGACDVPDLSLLPDYVPGVNTVTFHAALEAPWEQLALWSMGWLTRIGVVDDWRRMVPTFRWLSHHMVGLGSDTGGMHIRLSGKDTQGSRKSCDWYLTARKNHGPEIPCVPALILARRLLRDDIVERGAYACLGLISLSEFDEETRDLEIAWEVVD